MNVLDMTLCNAVSAVKAGRISSAELVQESLSAITQMNPELQAVIAVQEDHAMTEAKRLDALPPDRRGLLHGVPLAHKDMFDRMGGHLDLRRQSGSSPPCDIDRRAAAALGRSRGGQPGRPEHGRIRHGTDRP